MRAVTYRGTKDLRVENVPDLALQQPVDIFARVIATICGADLHPYRGRIPGMEDGAMQLTRYFARHQQAGEARISG